MRVSALFIVLALVITSSGYGQSGEHIIYPDQELVQVEQAQTSWQEIMDHAEENPAQVRLSNGEKKKAKGRAIPSYDSTWHNPIISEIRIPNASPGGSQRSTPAPTIDFQALADNNTNVVPPDTHGAVGISHLMTVLNTEVRIQNKSDGSTATGSTVVPLTSFWSALSPSPTDIFDPRVHYDPYGGRWIVVTCADRSVASSSLLIAVSQTNDPTGSWNLWRIDADPNNVDWFDYPTVGFNNRWIAVQGNMYNNSNNAFAGSKILLFNKSSLYSGFSPSPNVFNQPANNGGTHAPSVVMDSSTNNIFLVQDFLGNSGGLGSLTLWKIQGSLANPSLTYIGQPSTGNTWNQYVGIQDWAPQLNSTNKIWNNDSKMQNVVYRNGSLWCAQHVFLPATNPTHTAVQWWELDTVGNILQQGRIEDPLGQRFFAFPSIAVNSAEGVLIGYSSFSASQYASAEYSYRANTDPANTLQASYLYKSGTSSYYKTGNGTINRWGDFSATVVDPNNDLDFWTIQEYAANPINTVDQWGTWWANVGCPVPQAVTSVSFTQPHCEGLPEIYTANTVSGANSYTWTILGGQTQGWSGGTETTNTATFTAGQVPGTIQVTANNACGSSAPYIFNSFGVALPVASFNVSQTTVDIDVPITIDQTPVGSYQYIWDWDGGFANPGMGPGPHTVFWSSAGQKTIQLGLLDLINNCPSATNATADIMVTIPIGVEEFGDSRISLYPNPSSGIVFAQIEALDGVEAPRQLIVYNQLGQEVYQKDLIVSERYFEIDLSSLPSGVYNLSFIAEDWRSSRQLVIE